jgi:TolB-like protein
MRPSTFRTWLVALLALAVLAPIGAQAPATVALSDFVVNSANPSFAYLGKGFAEIIAFEVKKAPQVKLVDREQRNKLLEEMEFSLSGLTDPSAQLEIGKLLSVRFLVSGSITDMGGPLLVSLSMVDVQTGVVVWNDQLTASSGKYAYIGAYFGKSLLKHFNATVSKSTEQALASTKEGDAESVVALSKGIAALDEGKKDEAKKQLRTAKKIDPRNAVAQAFLDKLATASAKFKVVPERYVSYYNPAYLGGMDKDRVYYSQSEGWHTDGYEDENNDQLIERTSDLFWGVNEKREGKAQGYLYPIGSRFGLGVEMTTASWGDSVVKDTGLSVYEQKGNQFTNYSGGSLQAGFALTSAASLGVGVSAARLEREYFTQFTNPNYIQESATAFGGFLGAVLRNRSGNLIWDILASWSTEPQYWFDQDTMDFSRFAAPVYVEQTLTASFFDGKAFVALKQVNDIFPDRATWYGRLMPVAEVWLFNMVALRAGAEGSIVMRDGSSELGWGATGGLSLKIWKISVDANYTLRQRPSRSLQEVVVPESIFFFSVSAEGLLRN